MSKPDDQRLYRKIVHIVKSIIPGPGKLLQQEIKEIKQLVIDAKSRVDNYTRPQAGQITPQISRHYHHANEAHPQGLETSKAELLRMLGKDGDGTARQLKVVVISGLGGSGKTILAKAAYNQVQDEEEFECKAWVTASDYNDVDNLLGNILDAMEEPRPPEFKDLSQHLRGFLQNKRYIIGIDDLQTQKFWNHVLFACPDNGMSSRIIVTTTNEQIARSCHKNCRVHKMQPLDKDSARALLERKAFVEDGCPNDLGKGLAMILDVCEYLPLGIVNMADYIRSVQGWNYDQCVDVCSNLDSRLVGWDNEAFVGMNQVFHRSYWHLDDNVKTCLLSLSTYPNDHVIRRKSLIRRWLAERLIASTENRPEEDVAKECFTLLVDHYFIVPIKVGITGQVKTFRVHRMMLQFIKDKASYENFVTWIRIHQGTKVESRSKINRLYLSNSSTNPPKIRETVDLSHVQSITFSGQATNSLLEFEHYKFLRVLDLENCTNLKDKNLYTVCKSLMLRYLSIRGNENVTTIPPQLKKLRCLETLDTRDTKVDTLPMEVIQLPELAHLFGEFKITCQNYQSNELKTFFSDKICKLQTLAGFFIDESPGFIKQLPHMTKLGKIKILCRKTPSNEVIDDFLLSLKGCFEKEPSPPNLSLHSLSIDFSDHCDLNFLDDLEVPSPCLLRSLKLCGKLTILPKFIQSDSLTELWLSGTNLSANLILCNLRSLQKLEFLKLSEEESVVCGAEEITWHSGWFVYLKRLCFVVPELPKTVIEEKAMQGLESLQLFCKRLGGFCGVKNLLRLEEVLLSSDVPGSDLDGLRQQVSTHPTRPKLQQLSVTDTGSAKHRTVQAAGTYEPARPAERVLLRSEQIQRDESRSNTSG